MAEFDRANGRNHLCAGSLGLTSFSPVANIVTIKGNQQAVKTAITMASVQATRISIWELARIGGGRGLIWFRFFFALKRNVTISK